MDEIRVQRRIALKIYKGIFDNNLMLIYLLQETSTILYR